MARSYIYGLIQGLILVFITFLSPSAGAYDVGPELSGSWYDPAKSGQGFTIQVLDSETALLTWFTFDTNGNQRWIQGVGDIDGNTISFTELNRFGGPSFGASFDPDDVEIIPSGTMEVRFDSCDEGVAEFSGASDLPEDTLELTRLTTVAGFDCAGSTFLSGTIHEGLSGAWYDQAQSGQGWMIEILSDETAVVYWFTYDGSGDQRWFIGTANVFDNTIYAPELYEPVGARFGPNFDPDDVESNVWGQLAVSHVECNRAVGYYIPNGQEPPGAYYGIQSLAPVDGSDPCDFTEGVGDLEGGLLASPTSYVDTSTNNPNAPFQQNNSPQTAQSVGSPATITGFATANSTDDGAFSDSDDPFDAYRLNIAAGQTIQLVISDWQEASPSANDLDLSLYEAGTTNLVDSSLTITGNEYLTVTETGQYDVVVSAYTGRSAYALHVSYTPVPTAFQALSTEAEFVSNELIVRRNHERTLQAGAGSSLFVDLQATNSIRQISAIGDGVALYKVEKDSSKAASAVSATSPRLQALRSGNPYLNYDVASGSKREQLRLLYLIKELQSDQNIKVASPNFLAQTTSNDPLRVNQWHYDQIALDQSWDITTGDQDVLVAILDTGVGPHPDLESNVRYDLGYDAVAPFNNFGSRPGDDPVEFFLNRSPISHGTHVAGTVAAVAGNSRQGAGVAPDVQIMPVRVLGASGGGSLFDIAAGIYWAAGEAPSSSGLAPPAKTADIINMSLGGFGNCPSIYQDAIDYARSQGIVVVAAAGNETTSRTTSPASCDGVISVAAVNQSEQPAFYSNCGPATDIAAPGGETVPSRFASSPYLPADQSACRTDPSTFASQDEGVWSTSYQYSNSTRTSSFIPIAGTSMASPHVAGVIALMKSVDPSLTPEDFDALLASGALSRDQGRAGWDPEFGFGQVDARQAVESANSSGGASPAAIRVAPASLFYGDIATSRVFEVSPLGEGVGEFDGLSQSNAPWLTQFSTLDVDDRGFGTYELEASRAGLLDALYRGTLIVRTTNGVERTVPVEIRVGMPPEQGDAGFLYLGVFDYFTGLNVDLLAGSGASGTYTFASQDLVPGRYYVIAFSDVGFDNQVCRSGNLCGFFPNSDKLEPVSVVGGAVRNLGFITVQPDKTGIGEAGAQQALQFRRKSSTLTLQSGLGAPLSVSKDRPNRDTFASQGTNMKSVIE